MPFLPLARLKSAPSHLVFLLALMTTPLSHPAFAKSNRKQSINFALVPSSPSRFASAMSVEFKPTDGFRGGSALDLWNAKKAALSPEIQDAVDEGSVRQTYEVLKAQDSIPRISRN